MNFIRKLGRYFFHVTPAYNFILYEFCARYVDRFNGDNNSNSEENGEYFFLRKELSMLEGGVVFDVGANVGKWASTVLNINSKVNLHCFEPCKTTYASLVMKNFPSNVKLNNFGLSDFEGVLVLNVYDQASGLNSVYLRRGVETAMPVKSEQISVSTVDKYCEKNRIQQIDLMKVDVEGHELAVFKGMRKMLDDGCIRVIQFEYGGCNLDAKIYLGDIWDFIEPYGFNFYKLFPTGPRYIKNYQQNLETFKYSNWVAIHKNHA